MNSSTRGNLIFISYYYPPSTQMAARRTRQLADFLVKQGWLVHVITTGTVDEPASSTPKPDAQPNQIQVTRLRDPLARVTAHAQITDAGPGRTNRDWKSKAVQLGRAVVPFDSSLLWSLRAARYARRLLRSETTSSVLLTSAPPFATTLAGFLVKRRCQNLRWVHELRDLVATNPIYAWGQLRRQINYPFERALLRRTDGLVFLTEEIEREYRLRYGLSAPGVVAYNGYDQSFADAARTAVASPSEKLRLLHVGSFYGARNPHTFLGGVGQALNHLPDAVERLSITFVGQLGQTVAEAEAVSSQLEALGLGRLVRIEAPVPHEKLRDLYRDADVLVLITHADGTSSYAIPGKLFEYIGVGKKILAVTEDPLPKKIVEENNFGWVCPHEEEAIARTLIDLLQRRSPCWQLDAASVEHFSFKRQAEKIETLLKPT